MFGRQRWSRWREQLAGGSEAQGFDRRGFSLNKGRYAAHLSRHGCARYVLTGLLGASVLMLAGCGDFFNKDTGGGTGGGGTTASYLYVGTQAGQLGTYSVSTTGALAGVGSVSQLSTSALNALAVTPNNAFLYAAVAGQGVFGLSINASTGVATLINTSALVSDVSPLSMTIDPSGNYVLVAGLYNGAAAVGEYQIQSDGTLAEITGSPYAITLPSGADATNLTVQSIAVAPNSSYIFVSLGQLGVAPLAFTTGGVVTPNAIVINPKNSTGSGATVANQDLGLAVDSSSKFLFVGETNVGIRVFTIGSSFPEISGSPFKAGGQPISITLDGTGGYVYAANATDSTISGYSLQASGTLTPLTGSPFSSVGTLPFMLALDQSKKYLIETNTGTSPDVQVYSFDATTAGKLNPGATVTNLAQASSIASTH